MTHRSRVVAAVVAAFAVLASPLAGTAAAFADEPPAIEPGSLFSDDFTSGLSAWTAIAGDLSAWHVSDDAHPIVSVDTSGQSAGDYIRPTEALALPDMYEFVTTLKIDSATSDASTSLLFDMSKPNDVKGRDMAVQFSGFDSDGNASVKVVSPLGVTRICSGVSPLTKGTWHVVKVRRAGGITAAWVDGQLIAAVNSIAAGGTIALGSFRSAFSIGAVSVDALDSVPSDQPTAASGCPWVPAVDDPGEPDPGTGTGTVTGDGRWTEATASADAPGHAVSSGEATISLDGDWRFTTDAAGTGESRGFADPATDVSSWDTMRVPGNWDTHDAYGTYRGVAWYRTTFQTGDLDASAHQRAILRLDAVYWDATVWLNGQRLGSHIDGYTPFEFDVSRYLVDGQNTLVVSADNTYARPAWWPWGGISRDVTLIRTGDVVVDHQEVVTSPDLSTGTAVVTSTVTLRNRGDADVDVSVSGRVADVGLGTTVRSAATQQVVVPAGGTADVALTADLAAGTFELWGLDSPNLYRFETAIDAGDRGGETLSDRFGIRSVVIEGTSFLLNGERIRLAGANRVADDPVNGNTEPESLVRSDLDRMKAAGMNMMRIIHYPQAPDLLDYADQIGMLLIVETLMRGTQTDDPTSLIGELPRTEAEMRASIPRDFNHPSIFAYSVGNEIASDTPSGITYDQTMAALARALDPTRYVTQASSRVDTVSSGDKDGSQFMDFVSVNLYGNFGGAVDHVHQIYPDVPVFVSEYSPDGYTFGTNRETLDFTTGSGSTVSAFRSREFVMGWSQWAFKDYRSDFTGSSPNLVRGWGDLDAWGRLKKAYDSVQSANAPIKSLTLTTVDGSSDGGAMAVATITPRGATTSDGPVYRLSGYSLVLRVTDGTGSVVGGSITPLPDIAPGDGQLTVPVAWSDGGAGVTARVTLLSPTGYELAVATAALAVPSAPTITQVVAASTSVRVRFDDPADTRSYRAEAVDADGHVAATVTTVDRYADLGGLTRDTAYTVKVTAVNTAGASITASADVRTAGTLPMAPKLEALVPVERGVVLGYSDDTANATFEVRVLDAATGEQLQDYTTKNRPSTRAEQLDSGRTVDVSIRRLTASGAAATVWSEALRSTPLSATSEPTLAVRGVVAGPSSGGVVIAPQTGVERYLVELQGPSGTRAFAIERAAVNLLPITGLDPSTAYRVTVSAQSATGTSDAWSGTITTTAPLPATLEPPTSVAFGNRGDDVYLTWVAADGQQPDGYIVTRSSCGTTTTTFVTGTEVRIGDLASSGGDYTVAAFQAGVTSGPSEVVAVPGSAACQWVVTPDDTRARADGSVPFSTTGSWIVSGVLGAGGYPSRYATASTSPTATWTAPAAGDTRFDIEVSLPDATSVTSARYTVHAAGGDVAVTVDQNAERNTWVDLGEYDFTSALPGSVTLSNGSGGTYLRASAVRFTPVGDAADVSAPTPTLADQRVAIGAPISGTGSSPGDAITVATADGTVVGTATVAADRSWSIVPSLAGGVWQGVTVTERDVVGWIGSATATITVVPAWDAATVYESGDAVSFAGSVWSASWWTQNQAPGDPYGPWQELAATSDGTIVWTASRIFTGGETVVHGGQRYVAQWWTRNQVPGDPNGPWRPVA